MDIMIVGEAYGEHEEREQQAFVGPTGWELTKLLDEAGIHRADCYLTNVFNIKPKGNKIEMFAGPKEGRIPGYPSIGKGLYIRAEFQTELTRLAQEINEIEPNVIIALGNTACWALLGQTKIMQLRGYTAYSTHTVLDYKVLPTYHPAAIFRDYTLRPTVIMDLMKAERESRWPDIRRPKREIWIEPTLEDLEAFYERYLKGCERISIDIETAGNQVTCVGFAPNKSIGLVIPFVDFRRKSRSYWPDQNSERLAWAFVIRICEGDTPKTFQNGLYDIAFLARAVGIKVRNAQHDTMLLHHALQPESLKGLGFLGSLYTDEGSWKLMRQVATIKRDD